MPNKNYLRGVRWERELKKRFENSGWVVLRTAGSHGFADLICIDFKNRQIKFIQCKVKKATKKLKFKSLGYNKKVHIKDLNFKGVGGQSYFTKCELRTKLYK